MQIREQGKQVQLIRTVYDKEIKRGKPVAVGTFDRYAPDHPTPEQVASFNLTDDEKSQLSAWLEKRQAEKDASTRHTTARMAAWNIDRVTAAVDLIEADQAALLWESLDRLRKALRKAGHKKPQHTKPVAVDAQNTASE